MSMAVCFFFFMFSVFYQSTTTSNNTKDSFCQFLSYVLSLVWSPKLINIVKGYHPSQKYHCMHQ